MTEKHKGDIALIGRFLIVNEVPEAIEMPKLIKAMEEIPVVYREGIESVEVLSIACSPMFPCEYYAGAYDWETRIITLFTPLWSKEWGHYRAWFGEAWSKEYLEHKLLGDVLFHEIAHYVSLEVMGYKLYSPSFKSLEDLPYEEIIRTHQLFDKEEEKRVKTISRLLKAGKWEALNKYIEDHKVSA